MSIDATIGDTIELIAAASFTLLAVMPSIPGRLRGEFFSTPSEERASEYCGRSQFWISDHRAGNRRFEARWDWICRQRNDRLPEIRYDGGEGTASQLGAAQERHDIEIMPMTPVKGESTDWFTPENVARYYRETRWQYRGLWTGKRSLALHYGYWDEGVHDHVDSLDRMNQELARRAQVSSEDYVLDAGCGWGGSSIWLAKNRGARSLGVSLDSEQVAKAQEKAEATGVNDRVSFAIGDFHRIQVPSETFDVVWAIESVCHSEHKERFAKEAFRVLKPGGRLVLSDYFRTSRSLDDEREKMLRRWLRQWVVPDLATEQEFRSHLEDAGFVDVTADDVTEHIFPSARRMFITGLVTSPLAVMFRLIRLHSKMMHGNWKSSMLQYRSLTRGTWRYRIFSATKR